MSIFKDNFRNDWYSISKIAQIWMVDSDTFEEQLSALYELEYKYSMLRDRPFNGMPKRQENILNKLESELSNILLLIKEVLISTFDNWLEHHALLSADSWSRKRVEDDEELHYGEIGEDAYQSMASEYVKYAMGDKRYNPLDLIKVYNSELYKIINKAMNNLNNFPSIKNMLVQFLPDYRDRLMDDFRDRGLEDFNMLQGKQFKTEEEVENYVESLTIDDVDAESLMFIDDPASFIEIANNTGLASDILFEFYKNFVFPLWSKYWMAQGIDKTRKNVQKVYDQLMNMDEDNIRESIATINIALNTAHQNGEMLEYIEQQTGDYNLRATLDSLSAGEKVEEWNEELREIGVQI